MITKLAKRLKHSVKLQPHQEDFRDKLETVDGLLAYHGLGSGKTLSSIASTLGYDVDTVVPAALRENYKKELKKFTSSGGKRNIISYESASKDGLKHRKSLNNALVIDEIQRIGNSGTKRSQILRDVAQDYKKRILLSGTPAQNNPSELAPLLKMLRPEDKTIPLSPTEFNNKFIENERINPSIFQRLRGVKPGVVAKAKNLEDFKKVIQGRIHYHPTDRTNFPQRINKLHKVDMSPEQRDIYNVVTEKANPVLKMKIKLGMPLSKQESKQLNAFMTAARQVSNTTIPYGGKEVLSPKIKALVANISAKPKDRHVVYSNYLDSGLNIVGDALQKNKIPHTSFTGKLGDKDKAKAVEDFNKKLVNTLLLSSAGAEGIDLKETKNIHILEPHWNKNKIEQVIGRGIRFGSHDALPKKDRQVTVHKYQSTLPKTWFQKLFNKPADISADTYLEELSEKKQELLDQFLDVMRSEGSKKSKQ